MSRWGRGRGEGSCGERADRLRVGRARRPSGFLFEIQADGAFGQPGGLRLRIPSPLPLGVGAVGGSGGLLLGELRQRVGDLEPGRFRGDEDGREERGARVAVEFFHGTKPSAPTASSGYCCLGSTWSFRLSVENPATATAIPDRVTW